MPRRAVPRPADRLAIVDRLLGDLPRVHAMDLSDDPPLGLWATDPACYQVLAEHCPPGTRSLETGSGLSTLLFAALGATHTYVTPLPAEAHRIEDYCRSRGIDTGSLTLVVGRSEDVLPTLDPTPLDLVLIDGCHGFPAPILDWFYAAARLRRQGILVVDDVHLPAVASLVGVLDRDPRWTVLRRSRKWVAYRRVDDGPLGQDWFEQPFLRLPGLLCDAGLARRVLGRARRALARFSSRWLSP